MAIVSKAVFEKQTRGAHVGTVVPMTKYASLHKSLDVLADGGALFLVTVRPPDEQLWLVAVLEAPAREADGWAAVNATPIAHLGGVRGELVFATGTGIQAKPGALGMSLQTPRILTAADETLLRGAAGTTSNAAKAVKPPAPANAARPANAATPAKATTRVKPAKPAKISTAAPAANGDGLAAVQRAVAAKDGRAALAAALDWWRATRSPALADLIDELSKRACSSEPVTEDKLTSLAARKDPTDMPRILAAVSKLPVSAMPWVGELLADLPDDPRIAMATARWAREPPTTSSSTYPFWSKLISALVRAGDVRVLPLLKKRLAKPKQASQFWPKFYAALTKAQVKLAERSAAPAVDAKALAKLVTAFAQLSPAQAASAKPAQAAKGNAKAPTGPLLAGALEHLEANRSEPAIDLMVARWREVRAPALADAIERATRLLPTWDIPLAASDKATEQAWINAFATPSATMPQLLAHFLVGGPKPAERRLALFTTLEDDPRIARRLVELAGGTWVSPERTQYWRVLYELLARYRDPRTHASLMAQNGNFEGSYYNNDRQGRRILGTFVTEPLRPPPELDAADRKALAAIDRLVARSETQRRAQERALVAAIAENLDDVGPRTVYADWLIERDHPRGELVMLESQPSLTPAQTKRQVALAKTPCVFGWLQEFAGNPWEQERDRGLYRHVKVHYGASALTWQRMPLEPLLGAVETIEMSSGNYHPTAEDVVAVMAAAPALKQLTQVPSDLVEAIAALTGARWKPKGSRLTRA